MRNPKIIFLWLFLFSVVLHAQESGEVIVQPPEVYEDYYEEEPIVVTPTKEEVGEVYYEKRNLDPAFKDKYNGKKYDYDRITQPPRPPSLPLFSLPAGIFQVLMYGVLAIIVLVFIYYIFKNAGGFQFGNERKKIKFSSSEEGLTEDAEDIENNDFPKLIQKAKSENDFRLAIRYYHLWVLQTLSDKKFISWNKDKTDYDYHNELKNKEIQKDFSNNVYVYDYIWYGDFQLNPQEFNLAESIFQRTLNKIK
ncbi:MAG TPA: hypothetical protein VKY36_02550 [Moheibacter sp.]|nr:hypothetical protein [Moheibacter sp.]